MNDRLHEFSTGSITVTWSRARCIHAARCVSGLPDVFEPGRKPWVIPGAADADRVAEVVTRCPTGALHYTRHDGGASEPVPDRTLVLANRSGPLYLLGDIEVVSADGARVVADTRIALCRCGASRNKPFCDNSHRESDFRDAGSLAPGGPDATASETAGPVRIELLANGPLRFTGRFAVASADGREVRACDGAKLCRCGQSRTKPWCDGSHRESAFDSGGR